MKKDPALLTRKTSSPNSFESGVEKRKYCMIFENRLEPCWPAEEVKTAACTAREKKIYAFAKANGWTAEIHDPGLSVIFKKITA